MSVYAETVMVAFVEDFTLKPSLENFAFSGPQTEYGQNATTVYS